MIDIKRPINLIVIHHSATPPNRHVTVEEIRGWHKNDRGFSDIGYHDVIYLDGSIKEGRDRETPGAHAQGYNAHSLGICVIGDGSYGFTRDQEKALKSLVRFYRRMYPGIEIKGHRDLPKAKTLCPGFDVADWLKENGFE
jgi:N-acetylmuramoyl-L-alanine amidase